MLALDGHVCFLQTDLSVSEVSDKFVKYAGSRLFFVSDISQSDYSGRMPGVFWRISCAPSEDGGRIMLKSRVIPCLDVKDGRVVKGVNFVNLRDAGDPVECAIAYDQAGADELCFLDITASHEDRGTLLDVVRRTAEVCFMPLTVGGGVREIEDIRRLLLAGADKASINSAAVADRQFVRRAAEKFGSQCVVVAIDAKQAAPGRWEIFTHGGRRPTGSTRSPMRAR